MPIRCRVLVGVTVAVALAGSGQAETLESVPELGLEELARVDITGATRKAQNLQHVAAAVYVITRDDILRSGAANLADALAMAPGIEAAKIGNNRWAVSARGGTSRFANKLQVLKDGRSLYSPLFSGIFWEAEDLVLEDIERIEVIRGPNAVTWGSNAVNGTINIVTRKARDTQGGLLVAEAGSEDRAGLSVRYGTTLGSNGHLRVYGKGFDRRPGFAADGARSVDESAQGMAGFRGDWLLGGGDRLSVVGETFRSRAADRYTWADAQRPPAYVFPIDTHLTLSGSSLQGRYERLADDGGELSLQAFFTHSISQASHVFWSERNTVDVDGQYRFSGLSGHDVVVGANYRQSADSISTQSPYVTFRSHQRRFQLASLFVNDEVTVIPDTLRLIAGARFEYNNFSGSALQPTLRFLWTPAPHQTVWGALSRANRTPSRAEFDSSIAAAVVPTAFLPMLLRYQFDPDQKAKSETVDAVELGYRHRFGQALTFDATAFVQRLRNGQVGVPRGGPSAVLGPPPYLQQDVVFHWAQRSLVRGLELSASGQVSPGWRLLPSYTWQYVQARGQGDPYSDATARQEALSLPRHVFSLRSQFTIDSRQQLDFWFKYKSRNQALGIPDRANLDVRYAWRAGSNLDLALVGQNLLHERGLEYRSGQLPSIPVEIGRSAYLKVEYRF